MIGSVEPWYEAICLAYGAAECVSIDYNAVHYRQAVLDFEAVLDVAKVFRVPPKKPLTTSFFFCAGILGCHG